VITEDDIVFIRRLIAEHPQLSRWSLSRKLCQEWNWVQTNGALRDVVCRGMMLMLHRAGRIEMPPVRRVVRNPMADRARPCVVDVDQASLHLSLAALGALEVRQVRRTAEEALFNSLRQQHHYLGSHSIALLAGIIDTCRLRRASATDLLARAIHAARMGLPTPALPPIPAALSTHSAAFSAV